MNRRLTASTRILTALLCVVALHGCSSVLPWSSTRKTEVNVAFRVVNNVPVIGFSYAGVESEGILATGRERTVFSERLAQLLDEEGRIHIGTEHVATVHPVVDDLGEVANALIGGDAFSERVLAINWRTGLATIFTRVEPMREGAVHRWEGVPRIPLIVDGRAITAIVDTGSPDSLTLPGESPGRYDASVELAGASHTIDIAVDPRFDEPRIGTRILVHYLIQVDYRRRTVAMWPY